MKLKRIFVIAFGLNTAIAVTIPIMHISSNKEVRICFRSECVFRDVHSGFGLRSQAPSTMLSEAGAEQS